MRIEGGTEPQAVAKAVTVRDEPVMQIAAGLLDSLPRGGSLDIRASGQDIPNAVSVANILTEDMLRGEQVGVRIDVDSESPPGIGMMVSTISIVLSRP